MGRATRRVAPQHDWPRLGGARALALRARRSSTRPGFPPPGTAEPAMWGWKDWAAEPESPAAWRLESQRAAWRPADWAALESPRAAWPPALTTRVAPTPPLRRGPWGRRWCHWGPMMAWAGRNRAAEPPPQAPRPRFRRAPARPRPKMLRPPTPPDVRCRSQAPWRLAMPAPQRALAAAPTERGWPSRQPLGLERE